MLAIAMTASKGQGEALPQLTLDPSPNPSSTELLEPLAMGVSGLVFRDKLAILQLNGHTLLTRRTKAFFSFSFTLLRCVVCESLAEQGKKGR